MKFDRGLFSRKFCFKEMCDNRLPCSQLFYDSRMALIMLSDSNIETYALELRYFINCMFSR